tara:strand:+ start:167 stop:466 length:300 start_codon:yes stop_codon:yes gene_type:complete
MLNHKNHEGINFLFTTDCADLCRFLGYYIEDDKDYVAGLRKSVKKVIKERQTKKDKLHVGLGNKFKAFFKDKALVTDLQSVTQVRWGFCSKQKGTRKNY